MAVSKQVADAYKNHFGVDVIGDTVETPILPSGSAEAVIAPSKIGDEPKKIEPLKTPSFSEISKKAFKAGGSTEYVPTQGVGYDYTKESKLLTDTQLQDKLNIKTYTEGTSPMAIGGGSEEYKALTAEKTFRKNEKQKILDQSDMLERKLNFQARQKELGVSALDEAASYVGTGKFTDITGVNYSNPLFYLAKGVDMGITAVKALGQGAISAVGTLGASIDLNAGDNMVGDFGEAVSDYAKIIKQKYPQLNPSKNIGSWEDPEFYVKGVAEMVPNLLGGVAAAMAGAAIGGAATVNPAGAVVGGIVGATSFGYAMESGNIYDDLITRGYSPSSAEGWSKTYGAIAAIPDALFHVKGLSGAVMHPLMKEVMTKGMQAEVKQTLFTRAKELVKKGVKKSGGAVIEGTTETFQQLAQNTVTKFYDKNQNLFDGLAESFVFGMGSGALVEAGQNMGQKDISKEAVIALQNEKAIGQAVQATELLQKTYPKDKDIAGLLLKTKTALQDAQIQTKIIDAKFVQENTTPVVQNEVLDATVSKNIHGKIMATFDVTLDDQNITFTSKELQSNEQDATLDVAKTTQAWLEKQVDSGAVTNIEQATQLNNSLKEIISPKVEEVQSTKNVDTIDPLIEEAKKYKSADEFDSDLSRAGRDISKELKSIYPDRSYIDALEELVAGRLPKKPIDYTSGIKVYHGTDSTFKEIDPSKSNSSSKTGVGAGHIFYTTDREIAESYGKNILESTLHQKNALVVDAGSLDWKNVKFEGKFYTINKLATIAEKRGYGSLVVENVRDTGGKQVGDQPAGFKSATTIAIFSKSQGEKNVKIDGVIPKNEVLKTPKKEKKNVTRFAERMKEQFQQLATPEEYTSYKMNEEIDRAAKIIEEDQKKAYSIAMGYVEANPEQMSFTNQSMIKQALQENNIDLANSLITHLSKEGTKAGQLIVSLKAMSQGYGPEKYMMDVLKARTALANKKLGSFKDVFQNIKNAITGNAETKVKKEVKARVKKAELTIEQKRKISIEKAKKFISDLQCK